MLRAEGARAGARRNLLGIGLPVELERNVAAVAASRDEHCCYLLLAPAGRPALVCLRFSELGKSRSGSDRTRLLVDELPGVCSVEATHPHTGNEFWIKVPQIHAVPRARRGCQGLPVRDAAAGLAVDRAQRSVAPDVLSGGTWMALRSSQFQTRSTPRAHRCDGTASNCSLLRLWGSPEASSEPRHSGRSLRA